MLSWIPCIWLEMRNWKSHTRTHTHDRSNMCTFCGAEHKLVTNWWLASKASRIATSCTTMSGGHKWAQNFGASQFRWPANTINTSNQKLINKQRPRLSAILVSGRSRAWPRSVLLQIYYNFFAPVFSGKKTCGRSPAQNSLTTLDRGGN